MDITKEIIDEKGNKIEVKVESPRLNLILQAVKKRGFFEVIKRYIQSDYNLEESMQIIEAIGKMKKPDFVIDDENRFAYENIVKWCHCDSSMKCVDPSTGNVVSGNLKRGIYIGGIAGSGKSWCLDIISAYCAACGIMIQLPYEEQAMQLAWNNRRADEYCDIYQKTGEVVRFKKEALLGIQDFGSEPTEFPMYMGTRMDVIRHIIEYRGDFTSQQLTFITSNMKINGRKVVERYGERVASRLQEMCNYFEINGKDRRINK